jgi:aspartyl-tRNA(Asn)/glutamyl-tRNA(Gln) amidotransferase subunit A
MTRLWQHGVAELSRLLARRAVSPRELLESALARIELLDPALNAVIAIDRDAAAAAAERAEARWRAGTPRSPVDGIPFTVKDNLLAADLPAVWGSRLFRTYVPEHDELPVGRLREAGAIVIGKTNVPELTLQGFTDNEVFGATRNPWDPHLTPGGSSGGAAASVAAGITSFAIGTDGGGSIRRPAGYTGLVGLKPSTGAVARGGGFPHILFDCEVVGPLTRTVEDAALVFRVLAGPDRRDRLSLFERPPPRVGPKRILYVPCFGDRPCDPAIRARVDEAARLLSELGHAVETAADLPFALEPLDGIWATLTRVGAALVVARHGEGAWPDIARMAREGAAIGATVYLEAIERLRRFRAEAAALFERIDVVLTPSSAAMPWPIGRAFPPEIDGREAGPRGHAIYTGWVNLCGHPAIGLPAEPHPNGLPIGYQLVGDFGADEALLAVAAQIEAARPWTDRWPALALD